MKPHEIVGGGDADETNANPQAAYGYFGGNPGTSRFNQGDIFGTGASYPFKVAVPGTSPEPGGANVLTGTGAFACVETSEGFRVEFNTANGNGVIAQAIGGMGMPPNACYFSGDVTYIKMK